MYMAECPFSESADTVGAGMAVPAAQAGCMSMDEVFKLAVTSFKEELDELEKTENVSAICKELLQNMDTRPDPLIPEVHGPVNLLWDRWFEGPQDPQACRCWIL
ncbi:guanine nucleotide-binding protein subunit gamma 2-like [Trifolium pratense]|uniref:Guanine nucleotide-binding protein subunit gamma 2-like n=1 Tax=Trifolium pratense TaxID=57577 RepID=A0A2K3L232_TRIPR|nr:guanine nucleotide-binding protein subunit gamma 2-like [Trifolium pratense]